MKKILTTFMILGVVIAALALSCNPRPFESQLEYSSCHSYVEYASFHPDWESFTKVRGEFTGLTNAGDAQNSIIIVEGEFSCAECEPIVYYQHNQWWIGIGTEQHVKAKTEAEAGKSYQYLVEIVEQGTIHYTVRCEGELILEWTGEHGGRHDYFNGFNTSLETYAKDDCSSCHQATHNILWAWDNTDGRWLDANVAYQAVQGTEDKVCDHISPTLYQSIEHNFDKMSDYCQASYEGSEILSAGDSWDAWRYDRNNDGEMGIGDTVRAIVDYFDYAITKAQAIEVVQKYFKK